MLCHGKSHLWCPCPCPSLHPCLWHSCKHHLSVLCRIHIHELQMNESTLNFAEDVGVRLVVQHARIQLSADWAAQLGAM